MSKEYESIVSISSICSNSVHTTVLNIKEGESAENYQTCIQMRGREKHRGLCRDGKKDRFQFQWVLILGKL